MSHIVLWRSEQTVSSGAGCICLFAHYDPDGIIDPYVLRYLRDLRAAGLRLCVISACAAMRDAEANKLRGLADTLILRENTGLDFGSWQTALALGAATGSERVLLANDSVYGPCRPLQPYFERARMAGLDAWGMVESREQTWHLQSWFLLLRTGVFAQPSVRAVFEARFAGMDKATVIERGELALGRALLASGARCGAASQALALPFLQRKRALNRMHFDWRALVVSGAVPFLKVELLRHNPQFIPGVSNWPRVLRGGYYPAALIRDHLARTAPRHQRPALPWQTRLRRECFAAAAASDKARWLAWSLTRDPTGPR